MNSIRLFRPGYIDVTLDLPGNWNECTRMELEFIASQLLLPYDSKSLFYAEMLLFFIQNRAEMAGEELPNDLKKYLNWEDIFQQHDQAFGWIHQDSTLTEQPYNRIKLGRYIPHFVYGPQNDFNDLVSGEFEDCDVFSIMFRKDQDMDHLAMIAAILFRPKKSGTRINYHDYTPDKLNPQFRKLPKHTLFLIYTWYCGCRTMLSRYFRHVFDRHSGKGDPDMSAFTKCIHAGAGPRNGSRKDIRATLLKEFLLDMDLQAKAAAEMEAELKIIQP